MPQAWFLMGFAHRPHRQGRLSSVWADPESSSEAKLTDSITELGNLPSLTPVETSSTPRIEDLSSSENLLTVQGNEILNKMNGEQRLALSVYVGSTLNASGILDSRLATIASGLAGTAAGSLWFTR
jgi:hypothetical protein